MRIDPFIQSLGIQYPVFQGGMAWVADGKLAAAVSNAGGLGIIGCGHAPAEVVAHEIAVAKELTNRPIGINVMLLSPHVDAVVAEILKEAAAISVVTTGAGNPARYIPKFKDAGIKVIPVVPSVGLARMMARVGVDAVIAEGMESGGHIGRLTTMALVPQVVDAVDIPVIAAGGIADGRGLAAALALGAVGVQMGTRFLAASECKIHHRYQEAVIKAKDIDTVVTGAFAGHAARVLKNPLAKQFIALETAEARKAEPDYSGAEELGNGSLRSAVETGDPETGSYMAGEIAGLIHSVTPAKTIVETTVQQASEIIGGLQA